ncbi:MAG: hypothetical protein KAU17_04955 [Spirochaetales bacterium]|jgi:hypothetical protein|nr:hypothetical protein [Spirochaetales bacterium]
MIPGYIDVGGVWNVLPPGIHEVTLKEVEDRYITNSQRAILFDGFKRGLENLKNAGCKTIYLDGSFTTDKVIPGDFDACWDPVGVDVNKIDPVLLDFSDMRNTQKMKYGGEFFPSSVKADSSRTFLEYFQNDKYTGKRKGIICIRL